MEIVSTKCPLCGETGIIQRSDDGCVIEHISKSLRYDDCWGCEKECEYRNNSDVLCANDCTPVLYDYVVIPGVCKGNVDIISYDDVLDSDNDCERADWEIGEYIDEHRQIQSNQKRHWLKESRPFFLEQGDRELLPILDDLNKSGCITDESCVGHSSDDRGQIYFVALYTDEEKILSILNKHGLKNIERFWMTYEGKRSTYYTFDPIGKPKNEVKVAGVE